MNGREIWDALSDLESTVLGCKWDEEGKASILRKIFALNNQIGKLARSNKEKMYLLRDLQWYVNSITIAVKGMDKDGAEKALKLAKGYFKDIQSRLG